MRKISMIMLPLLLCSSGVAFAQMSGGMGGMGGSGGGMGGMSGMGGGGGMGGAAGDPGPQLSDRPRPPSPPKPIKRERWDKVVTAMFQDADTNRDGTVTVAELHTLVEGRRNAVITARFASIDTDRNGSLSKDEFFAWQRQMGSIASQDADAFGRDGPVSEAVAADAGRDVDDRMLAAMIEPITGTLIAKANTNYDAGLSLAELLAYEGKIFDAADADKDGYLNMQEMRPKGGAGGPPRGPGGPPPGAPPPGAGLPPQ